MPRSSICVAGNVTYDYMIYQDSADNDELVIRPGAADLITRILATVAPQRDYEVNGPALLSPSTTRLQHNASTIISLHRRRSTSQGGESFDVADIRQIGKRSIWHSPPLDKVAIAGATTVILTGSGDPSQDVEPALDLLRETKHKWLIYHMTLPLARGRLWDVVRNGPMVSEGVPDPDRLAVIVDADDLRAEGVVLSRSLDLSWEATAEDFVRNLGIGHLDTLVTCPNLIVRFGNEGVIWHRGRISCPPRLFFFPGSVEQDYSSMLGLASAFTAGFAMEFPNVEKGIRCGMRTARNLSQLGFQRNMDDDGAPDYPVKAIVDSTSQKRISSVDIPSLRISSGDDFSTFDVLTGDPSEVARQIVTAGPDRALTGCSVRRFGNMRSVDRVEQESLGAMTDTLNERLSSINATPTCIGLLGPIGSGKKFSAKNLSAHVGRKWATRQMTCNTRTLSQDDLVNVCHSIRDNTADKYLTIVSFESSEALLEPGNILLDQVTSLMRDGSFKDKGQDRLAGRCLLVFLVNQLPPRMETTPTPTRTEFSRSTTVDNAALVNNLHGVVNLRGLNPTGPQDRHYMIRRALCLRQLLYERHPHLLVSDELKIDDAVLHALLFVPSYKYGLRSLEKIISTSRLSGKTRFDVSSLPPEESIQLHAEDLVAYLRLPKLPPTLREKLAEGLFERYKKQRTLMAKTEDARKALLSDRSMVDWEDLSAELRESTRAQADDIPRKLRAVGCFMLNEVRDQFEAVPEFSTEDLDLLSEMEHERFNAERLQRQWRMGSRNSKQRTTPFLVPWRDLTQEWKDVDRVMVECVPGVLKTSSYYIYRHNKFEGD